MKVAIVGMGTSRDDFINELLVVGTKYDEVWGINAIGNVLRCDKIFMMDDIKLLDNMQTFSWIRGVRTPIITSVVRPEITEMCVSYPYEEIVSRFNIRYFSNTVAYAIAYAVHTGVTELTLFGCDYDYNGEVAEVNRAGTEFWLGIAYAVGVKVAISDKSSLMNMNGVQAYAYDTNPSKGV